MAYILTDKEKLHRTFGGVIGENDFGRHFSMSSMADRIIQAWRFDKACKKHITRNETLYDKPIQD